MYKESGITLTTLVVTIIIIFILAGVVTYSGVESINEAKKIAFVSELEMIQAKVDTIYEKRKTDEEQVNYYNQIGEDATVLDDNLLITVLGKESEEGYRYFTQNDLEFIGLENITQEVLINYDTRQVISLKGIEIDGKKYYKLEDIPDYTMYQVK